MGRLVGHGTLYFVVGKPAKLVASSTKGKLVSQYRTYDAFSPKGFLG